MQLLEASRGISGGYRVIPAAAAPVVAAIRRNVPRPQPRDFAALTGSVRLRCSGTCPQGMIPGARVRTPYRSDDFDGRVSAENLQTEAIRAFARWWDSQTDPEAAVAAVWGR